MNTYEGYLMNIENFLLASAGAFAYELLFWKELLANEIKNGEQKIKFRVSYAIILIIWLPICGLFSIYLFQDDITKSGNFILVGFGLPAALKTISSKVTASLGARGLGKKEIFSIAIKTFFHVGAKL